MLFTLLHAAEFAQWDILPQVVPADAKLVAALGACHADKLGRCQPREKGIDIERQGIGARDAVAQHRNRDIEGVRAQRC